MLSKPEAIDIAKKHYPSGKVNLVVEYRGLYLLQIFGDLGEESGMDPFFSVDKETGEFEDFSILHDGDISEISDLFLKEMKSNE